jgi:osmotically-inducible protein OsmY
VRTAHTPHSQTWAARVPAHGQGSGHGNDQVIIEGVRAALERDSRIADAAEIAIAAQAGMVTLRGAVRGLHQRQTAVDGR